MPHKHTRRNGDDGSSHDLAPSIVARPLLAYTNASKDTKKQHSGPKRRQAEANGYNHDDTPRAFSRMMQLQHSKKRQRSGLDDGTASSASKTKKRRVEHTNPSDAKPNERPQDFFQQPERPQILPGERLADFAARVNHALPVGGLARKGKLKGEGLKERQTKTEKRLQKMYSAWREEDARRKEKLEEQRELEEEREAEFGGESLQVLESGVAGKKGKRRQRADGVEDPWAELKMKRERPRGLHDVVQAPPNFKAVPKEKFKVRNGAKVDVANIPSAAGSLKRREELSAARRETIERYRAMMGKGGSR